MNKLTFPRPCLSMSCVAEYRYRISRRRLAVCRLWRMRSADHPAAPITYAIGLESLRRRYLYCLGTDEARALSLAQRIADERLEPAHLGDVVADFLWAEEQGSFTAAESE